MTLCRGRVEVSGGALLLLAVLYYFDGQGLLPWCLAACVFHELGHYLVIRLLGGRVARLRVTCVGAEMALSARRPLGCGGELAAALAGPAVNLILALGCARLGTEWGYCFAGINLAQAALNLLPAAQLDGGRALRCVLTLLWDEETGGRLVRVLSPAMALGLFLGSVLLLRQGRGNLTLLLTAAWLLSAALEPQRRMLPNR